MEDRSPDGPAEAGPDPVPVSHDYRPKRAGDVFEMDMGDGLILYNRDSQLVHHLNPTAAVLWRLAEGEASAWTLATEIAEQYELEPAEVVAQVATMLGELESLGLVFDGRENATSST